MPRPATTGFSRPMVMSVAVEQFRKENKLANISEALRHIVFRGLKDLEGAAYDELRSWWEAQEAAREVESRASEAA